MRSSTKRSIVAAAVICALAAAGGAVPAQDKETVIKNREALMKCQGLHRWQGGPGAGRGRCGCVDPVDEKNTRRVSAGFGRTQPRWQVRGQTCYLERLEQVSRCSEERGEQGRRAPRGC